MDITKTKWASPVFGGIAILCALLGSLQAGAQEKQAVPTFQITRTASPIKIDADLSDDGWKGAARVDRWYETNPGDNTPPQVESVGWLTYDDKYLYAAFEFSDPDPSSIRGPFAQPDNISVAYDYGGLFIDSANDGKTAALFLTTARGVQYDALSSDSVGEDAAPDYYWDSSARITERGWILEMRVPFSSLRYPKTDPQTWGILLYRNWPRNNRTQMFSAPLGRGVNCLICQSGKMTGLQGLPHGGNWTLAPYATARQVAVPEAGPGTRLKNQSLESEFGLDAKWTPNADTAVDLTLNPDFSQVEADVAQISVNERFALLYPEKRPFFLEGKNLFNTPIEAAYTRTITEPEWGLRATGRVGTLSYTALATNDEGGGQVVIPGSQGSSFVDQDFESTVGIARIRYDIGQSFLSFLATSREMSDGFNRVFGPDFNWQPSKGDQITGQVLRSVSHTPNRTDLTSEWDGRKLESHAAQLEWFHTTPTIDWFLQYRDVGDEFRADNGFVPQVGYRAGFGETGYTFRPKGSFFTRIRTFLFGERIEDRDRELLSSYISAGFGMDGGFNSFMRYRYVAEDVLAGSVVLPRNRFFFTAQFNPSQTVNRLVVEGNYGQQIDFANSRAGHGGSLALRGTFRPTLHLELGLSSDRRWVDVSPTAGGSEQRLFTASIHELRSTYTFTPRAYLRLIAQYMDTKRDPSLYLSAVEPESKSFNATALFTYKLNWQSVLFVGYGDERALDTTGISDDLEPTSRQWFLKISYAFQGG